MRNADTPIEQPATDRHRGLLLDELGDRFQRFRLFRKTDSVEADKVLAEIGAHSVVDRDIVLELSSTRPLGHPERFMEAHTLAMRSLEVLDRNGGRGVKVGGGPLGALAGVAVQLISRFIVRSYQGNVIDDVVNLYRRCTTADAWKLRYPCHMALAFGPRRAWGFLDNRTAQVIHAASIHCRAS